VAYPTCGCICTCVLYECSVHSVQYVLISCMFTCNHSLTVEVMCLGIDMYSLKR